MCTPMAAFSQNTQTDADSHTDTDAPAKQADRNPRTSNDNEAGATSNKFNLRARPTPTGINSRQAAVIAKQHAGGKVLRVHATQTGHRIKMLLPSGKVTYILVGVDGQIIQN
ncbi:hypothetical protein GCM10025791_16460 [Halioxenophilus aromaticivorans]|uniref:PepSY domain-containing protein n=1 Tax=Halioxenophilus aromaticivorans TaxID=1306992 RepID=A0AAV3U1D0_9ALTE